MTDEVIREMVRQRRLLRKLCDLAADLGFSMEYDGDIRMLGDRVLAESSPILIENKIFLGYPDRQVIRKLFSSIKWSRHLIIALADDNQHIIWGQKEV